MTDYLASQFIGWDKMIELILENAVGIDDKELVRRSVRRIRRIYWDYKSHRYEFEIANLEQLENSDFLLTSNTEYMWFHFLYSTNLRVEPIFFSSPSNGLQKSLRNEVENEPN